MFMRRSTLFIGINSQFYKLLTHGKNKTCMLLTKSRTVVGLLLQSSNHLVIEATSCSAIHNTHA